LAGTQSGLEEGLGQGCGETRAAELRGSKGIEVKRRLFPQKAEVRGSTTASRTGTVTHAKFVWCLAKVRSSGEQFP
jgi:hypothetical protein